MTCTLVRPGVDYERSYREYIVELRDEERYPFPLDFVHDDFAALLRRLDAFANGVDIPEGFVPSTTYWLVEAGEIVGVSSLRHHLNERILRCGGHIGLGIRPSRRGQGLGNLLMHLTLREATQRGLETVHLHCHKANAASSRMIMRNGGVLMSEIEDGNDVVQRFVIVATGFR